jgi:hypothetical protein
VTCWDWLAIALISRRTIYEHSGRYDVALLDAVTVIRSAFSLSLSPVLRRLASVNLVWASSAGDRSGPVFCAVALTDAGTSVEITAVLAARSVGQPQAENDIVNRKVSLNEVLVGLDWLSENPGT